MYDKIRYISEYLLHYSRLIAGRLLNEKKIYYLHIPKTAGTALNKFLRSNIDKNRVLEHIESRRHLLKETKVAEDYDFISGHIPYDNIKGKFDTFKRISTFREPLSHVQSHLTYVREIALDKKRYAAHPPNIQEIIDKLQLVDFADPNSLKNLIIWLEDKQYYLFHNVLTVYLTKQNKSRGINSTELEQALENIERLDYVGLQERLEEFMLMLSYYLNIDINKVNSDKLNVTANRYGLDISSRETVKALNPLICYDTILYEKAREIFINQFYDFLKSAEINNEKEYLKKYHEMIIRNDDLTRADNKLLSARKLIERLLR